MSEKTESQDLFQPLSTSDSACTLPIILVSCTLICIHSNSKHEIIQEMVVCLCKYSQTSVLFFLPALAWQCMCTRFSVVTIFSASRQWFTTQMTSLKISAVHVHQIQCCDCLFSLTGLRDTCSACAPDSALWLSFQLQASDLLHKWPVW